ncbi:MAG: hypothetical protein O9341_07830 [Paucibacter sp.]|nr:hypothetical protein [Roseateles sp.]
MPEPTSTAVVTTVAAGVAVPALSVLGVPLGLRPDLLIAGFNGALVAIILLNSVPSTGDTWRELVRTTMRRMAVAVASSLTAGYLATLTQSLAPVPESLLLGAAFVTGAAAQRVLRGAIRRLDPKAGSEVAP